MLKVAMPPGLLLGAGVVMVRSSKVAAVANTEFLSVPVLERGE
jgi:hypothetical protein